jgi:oligopeptide/dipeptide ABC transporter ATP-binding protein
MAMLFISHDLGVIARLCERIMVMYAGQIVEDGAARDILDRPRHWYTAALVDAARHVAGGAGRLPTISGQPPSLTSRPAACRFAPRCSNAQERCRTQPPLEQWESGRRLRCFFPRQEA